MHSGVPAARAAPVLAAAIAAAALLVSGGSGADPRTPPALPGMPPPFLGTAAIGGGRATGAVDAYGDLVDLRARPAGRALIDNPSERQAAGTVPGATGIVPRLRLGGGPALPSWRADRVGQRYLPGTNVVRTTSFFGRARLSVTEAASGGALAVLVMAEGPRGVRAAPVVSVDVETGVRCERERSGRVLALQCATVGRPPARAPTIALARATIRRAARGDRRWIRRARPLDRRAPGWARRLYRRSLLALRALIDDRSGALAAGARDGWAYVWPRDAATAALALRAAGYEPEAYRVADFLRHLDLGAAARFDAVGRPIPGRAAQGDASGWVAAAVSATASHPAAASCPRAPGRGRWRGVSDYREGDRGDYLGNAIAAGEGCSGHGGEPARWRRFATRRGLVRTAGDPGSGLDAAAAWAVRPFALRPLRPRARETMLRLAARGGRFGITPGEGWPGSDPWMAPTAWTAWSLAALSRTNPGTAAARRDRRVALGLLGDLRRAATPAGALPERVDADSGVPRSTTPLAWAHAFAVLALLELWPPGAAPADP